MDNSSGDETDDEDFSPCISFGAGAIGLSVSISQRSSIRTRVESIITRIKTSGCFNDETNDSFGEVTAQILADPLMRTEIASIFPCYESVGDRIRATPQGILSNYKCSALLWMKLKTQ